MNISDLQTMDFIIKNTVLTKESYEDSNLKILLKCDDILMYGDLVRVEDDYVCEPEFDMFHRSVRPHYIGTSLRSDETKQIDLFKKARHTFKTDLDKQFFMFINSEKNLEILNKLVISLIKEFPEQNVLPHNLYDATFINVSDSPKIPVVNLDSFNSVQFISIIEAPKN
ncbi:hypothetical protein ACK8HD_10935 [Enterococcus faecium]|uniref:hypothetical protein n=1 Tax=Enterococcus faecium TaxID=1352 RepID=UPI003989F036